MPPKYLHLVAAWALAVAGPTTLAAVCGHTPLWGPLGAAMLADRSGVPGTSGFSGFDDCGAALNAALAPTEPDLTSVSLYGGTRFITSDAAPGPFTFHGTAPAGSGRPVAAPAAPADTGLVAFPDAGLAPQALALLFAGFFGVGVGALRRKAA